MLIPRSIARAATVLATAVAVTLPVQPGLAATASFPADGPLPGRLITIALPHDRAQSAPATSPSATTPPPVPSAPSGGTFQTGSASPVKAGHVGDADEGTDDTAVDDSDDSDDDVQVVDGTDAPEDDADVLADDSGSSSGSTTRRDKTSGKWAQIARPTVVRARLAGASSARVTWRSSVGGVLAQRFVVELRAGRSVLRATTFSSARSAIVWGLSPAKRYSVSVTAVAADGTRKAATGAALRTPAAVKATKPTSAAKASASSAKVSQRHAKAVRFG